MDDREFRENRRGNIDAAPDLKHRHLVMSHNPAADGDKKTRATTRRPKISATGVAAIITPTESLEKSPVDLSANAIKPSKTQTPSQLTQMLRTSIGAFLRTSSS